METPDTPSQQKARAEFDEACRDLSAAAVALRDAQHRYDRANERYDRAFGAAKQAGVVK